MKNLSYIIIGVAVFAMVSCTSTNKINTSVYTTRQQPINREAVPFNPVIADLKVDIDKKVTGSAIRQVELLNESEVDNTKQLSLYNAMTSSGADVVVDPIFKVEITNNNGKDKKVTIQSDVSGYYGKYTSVHKADTTELKTLMLFRQAQGFQYIPDKESTPILSPQSPTSAKKKGKKIALAIILPLVLTGLGLGLGLTLPGR